MKSFLIVALALFAMANADEVLVSDGTNNGEVNIIPDPFFAGGAQAPQPNILPDPYFAGGSQAPTGYQTPNIKPEYVQSGYGRPSRYDNPDLRSGN